MRILLLSDFGIAQGGAEIATLMLRDGLRERGHEALLLSSSARPTTGLPMMADIVVPGTLSSAQPWLQMANPFAYRALGRVVREFKPDLVHVGIYELQLSPLILPVIRHLPVVHRAHWLRGICPTGAKLLPNRSLCQKTAGLTCYQSGCLSLADWVPAMAQRRLARRWRESIHVITAVSEATRAAFLAEGFLNVRIIYNGFPATPARPPLSNPPTACFAGRLVKEKGIDVLLRAWKQVLRAMPEARLIVAGEGPDRPILESNAAPGVSFLGYLPTARLEAALATAWVQVVPSVCFEAFGRVAAEAMMRGTAVIASRVGGLPEVVEEGVSGLLLEPNAEDSLAQALLKLLGDRPTCERMGAAGRQIAQRRFGEDAFIESHIRLYEELITNQGSGAP